MIFIGCPIEHQYVFDNGRKCCSTNRKTNDSNLNNTFNGGDLLFDSISCAGTFIDCPIQQQYGGCLNLGKITNTMFFKFGSQHLLSENPLPTHFNLPSDYQNVKNQLGSIFYKTLQNKMGFLTAKNQCELDGILSNSTVHLPIPKSG